MTSEVHTGKRGLVRGLLVDLAVMTVIGVVLAVIGPFGSFNDPFAIRLMVWVGFAWLGYVLYAPIDMIAQKLAPTLDLPTWSLRLVGCLIASAPMAVAVWLIPRGFQNISWPGADEALEHYLLVAMVGGMITVLNSLIQRQRYVAEAGGGPAESVATGEPQAEPQSSAPGSGPRFLDRLPPELGSELIALEMEDHYVRAHTALGSELVLLRLRDAMAELDGIEGLQVHRSWWVARGAVEDVVREGRNVRLKLARGIEAPVSRANVAVLKDAGWI